MKVLNGVFKKNKFKYIRKVYLYLNSIIISSGKMGIGCFRIIMMYYFDLFIKGGRFR